jgi:hypothetical protein
MPAPSKQKKHLKLARKFRNAPSKRKTKNDEDEKINLYELKGE